MISKPAAATSTPLTVMSLRFHLQNERADQPQRLIDTTDNIGVQQQSYPAKLHFPTSPASNAQLLARESCSLNPRFNLLHRYISCKIRASMLRLDINTKGAKAAIVRRA